MKNICVVTSTRADYGILKPLIELLSRDKDVNVFLVVTGTHLVADFGMTINEVFEDSYEIDCTIPIYVSGNSAYSINKTISNAITGFSDYFTNKSIDLLVVMGDRYEIAAVCMAAISYHIPIAHLAGGEITEGALDDIYRNIITKMSILHFASCEEYRKRIVQLGENPEKVFNFGDIAIDNIIKEPMISLGKLSESLEFNLLDKPFAVVTYHPVTLENDTSEEQIRELLSSLDEFPNLNFIITKANADAGGEQINKIINKYSKDRSNVKFIDSLGMKRYISAIKQCLVVIGNSSSGILEVPAVGKPTVNIGDRQKGRIMSESIICCKPCKSEIVSAIEKAISPSWQELCKTIKHPWGDGNTSPKILNEIKKYLNSDNKTLKKHFYDIDFEVK